MSLFSFLVSWNRLLCILRILVVLQLKHWQRDARTQAAVEEAQVRHSELIIIWRRTTVNYILGKYPWTTVSGCPVNRTLFFLFSWLTKIWVKRLTDLVQRLCVRYTPVLNTQLGHVARYNTIKSKFDLVTVHILPICFKTSWVGIGYFNLYYNSALAWYFVWYLYWIPVRTVLHYYRNLAQCYVMYKWTTKGQMRKLPFSGKINKN